MSELNALLGLCVSSKLLDVDDCPWLDDVLTPLYKRTDVIDDNMCGTHLMFDTTSYREPFEALEMFCTTHGLAYDLYSYTDLGDGGSVKHYRPSEGHTVELLDPVFMDLSDAVLDFEPDEDEMPTAAQRVFSALPDFILI